MNPEPEDRPRESRGRNLEGDSFALRRLMAKYGISTIEELERLLFRASKPYLSKKQHCLIVALAESMIYGLPQKTVTSAFPARTFRSLETRGLTWRYDSVGKVCFTPRGIDVVYWVGQNRRLLDGTDLMLPVSKVVLSDILSCRLVEQTNPHLFFPSELQGIYNHVVECHGKDGFVLNGGMQFPHYHPEWSIATELFAKWLGQVILLQYGVTVG